MATLKEQQIGISGELEEDEDEDEDEEGEEEEEEEEEEEVTEHQLEEEESKAEIPELPPDPTTIINVRSTTETVCKQKENSIYLAPPPEVFNHKRMHQESEYKERPKTDRKNSVEMCCTVPNDYNQSDDTKLLNGKSRNNKEKCENDSKNEAVIKEEIPYNPSQVFLAWMNEGIKHKAVEDKPQRKIQLTYSKRSLNKSDENNPVKLTSSSQHSMSERQENKNLPNIFPARNRFPSRSYSKSTTLGKYEQMQQPQQPDFGKDDDTSLEDNLVNIPMVTLKSGDDSDEENHTRNKMFSRNKPRQV